MLVKNAPRLQRFALAAPAAAREVGLPVAEAATVVQYVEDVPVVPQSRAAECTAPGIVPVLAYLHAESRGKYALAE